MNKIKAVVIDDEYFNRGLISMLITRLNQAFIISGEAESVSEGFKIINELRPDVVFLDIKMPDGSGFEILEKFESIYFEVVFITGFDDYTMEAFEHNALDYVLKPVDLDKFKDTLEKVQQRIFNKNQGFRKVSTLITKIPVHVEEEVILLDLKEVQFIVSESSSLIFCDGSGRKYTEDLQFEDLEFMLNRSEYLLRVNSHTFINLDFVEAYQEEDTIILLMKNGDRISTEPAQRHLLHRSFIQKEIKPL